MAPMIDVRHEERARFSARRGNVPSLGVSLLPAAPLRAGAFTGSAEMSASVEHAVFRAIGALLTECSAIMKSVRIAARQGDIQ